MALLTRYIHDWRHEVVRRYLHRDILDLGCGPARTISMLGLGQRYVGLEVDRALVDRLRARYPRGEFYRRDLDRDHLDLGNRRFGTILLLAVIEHLRRPEWLLQQLGGYMEPDGHLLITTPYPAGNKVLRVGARLGLFRPEGINSHASVYSRTDMARLLQPAGLEIATFRGFLLGMNQLFLCRGAEDQQERGAGQY